MMLLLGGAAYIASRRREEELVLFGRNAHGAAGTASVPVPTSLMLALPRGKVSSTHIFHHSEAAALTAARSRSTADHSSRGGEPHHEVWDDYVAAHHADDSGLRLGDQAHNDTPIP